MKCLCFYVLYLYCRKGYGKVKGMSTGQAAGDGLDLGRLNPAQRAAAEELDENILLLAPAGTGKTDTLAYRVANIILSGRAQPEEILCLTFTNKACREMRQRIEERAGAGGLRVPVKTFHGFCYDIIKTEAKRSPELFADFTIVDEVDCQSLLREISENKWPVRALQALTSLLKESQAIYREQDGRPLSRQETLERLLLEQQGRVRSLAVDDRYSFYQQLYQGWCKWGASLAGEYDERLRDMHGLDFTDLIVRAQALLSDREVRAKWARRFLYINIDEVQDTNELEYSLISHIFGESRLLLCGDYFQTIYEWRGSRPEAVLRRYQRDCHPRRIVLRTNYRSTQVLLSASFGCLAQLFPERVSALYPEGLEAVSSVQGEPIELKGAVDFNEEAQWLYYRIQRLPVEDYARVCILTRNNKYNKELSSQFRALSRQLPQEERLPFMLIEELKFFRRQEIKDALAFLRLTVNKHDAASLVRLLNRFGKGIGPATIKAIGAAEVRRTGLSLTDFLDDEAWRAGDVFAPLTEALAAGNVVVFDVESTGLDPTRDEIIQIAGIRLAPDGRVAEEFKRNIRPTCSVGGSVRVHGLTDAWLAEHGEDAEMALAEFAEFARGAVLVGHNVTYDLGITSSCLARLGLPQLDYPCYYDTLDIFCRFYPNLPDHKLESLYKFCGAAHASSHDAMDDILATADILLYALRENIVPQRKARRAYFAKWQELFRELAEEMHEFRAQAPLVRPWKLIGEIVNRAGIKDYYERHKEAQRVENLRDLYRQARDVDDITVQPLDAIARFLRYTTLSNTELDVLTKKQIPIITVHQAKGSEFDYVFLAGMQEGTFPGFQAEKNGSLDEEARLFYVAITRAKKQLFISWTQFQCGHMHHMSRFIHKIPRQYIKNSP